MWKSSVFLGVCLTAILASQASAAGDPWGVLDDLVGKRFSKEFTKDADLLNRKVEFSWEQPGKVIREQSIGKDEYYTYELTTDGRGILRRHSKLPDTDLLESRGDGSLVWTTRYDDLGMTMFGTWKLDGSGQPSVYYSSRSDRQATASPPKLSHRYAEAGVAVALANSNLSNSFASANDWGALAAFANLADFHGDRAILVRVSDDGRYLEFIEIWQDRTRLFGLLRAEGGGRFRFLQANISPGVDGIYEGRLEGHELVLPSLVEPQYQVRIGKEYNEKVGADALHAREIGPEKSWLYYSFLEEMEFSDEQLAPALKASADQRARFDDYFAPARLQAIRDSRSRTVTMDEALAHIAAENEASDAEFEAHIERVNNMPASGTRVGNVLGGFMKGFSEEAAKNQAMEQSMENAINRGLAEGAAEYARRNAGSSYDNAAPRSETASSPGSTATAAPDGAAPAEDKGEGVGSVATVVLAKGFRVPITPGATSNEMCFTRFSIGPITSDSSRRMPEAMEAMASAKSDFLNECSKLGELTSGSGVDDLLLDAKAESAYGNFRSNKWMHEVTVK